MMRQRGGSAWPVRTRLNRARFELSRLRGRVGLGLWAVFVSVGVPAQAAPLMHGIFQDHAVLQRDRPIEVWGHAAGGEDITVSLAAASGSALADASGRWSVMLT